MTNEMQALTNEYIDLEGVLDVYAHSHDHFTTKQQKLAALVREEKSRADFLQKDLEFAVACSDAEQQRHTQPGPGGRQRNYTQNEGYPRKTFGKSRNKSGYSAQEPYLYRYA